MPITLTKGWLYSIFFKNNLSSIFFSLSLSLLRWYNSPNFSISIFYVWRAKTLGNKCISVSHIDFKFYLKQKKMTSKYDPIEANELKCLLWVEFCGHIFLLTCIWKMMWIPICMQYACLKHIMHYSLGRTNWWYNNKRLKNPCNTCWRTILYLHIMHLYTSKNEKFIISFTNYEYICSRLKSRALSLNMH